MQRLARIILPLILVLGCYNNSYADSFNQELFENSKFNHYLAFDLRSDSNPKAAFLVRNTLGKGHYTVNIPFESKDIKNNPNIFSASGSYKSYTLLDFDINNHSPALSAISFTPIMHDATDAEILQNGYSEYNVYMIKRGLERHFIFSSKYPYYKIRLENTVRYASELHPQCIAVALPNGAKGIEIRNTKKINIPDPIDHVGNVYFYPYSGSPAGKPRLEIKYMLKETPLQTMAVDALLKLILVLIPSGLALLLIEATDVVNPRLRKYGLIACGALVVLAIAGLLTYSFVYQDNNAREGIVDIVISIVSATFAIIVFFVKRKPSSS